MFFEMSFETNCLRKGVSVSKIRSFEGFMRQDNSKKIILDLCGGTGSWSKPYRDAGYDVRVVTLPEWDVRKYEPPSNIYGILAAPPCTHFSGSGALWWPEKDKDGRTLEDLEIATICLMIIAKSEPKFWALENPVGRLKRWFRKPDYYFNPCDFGDPYTKKTCLWGKFNLPEKNPVEPEFGVLRPLVLLRLFS